MKKMRILNFCVFLFLACPIAFAASPKNETFKQVWTTGAVFRAPESAVYDPSDGVLYISNMEGSATGKDGKGFISKVDLNGKVLTLEWVSGLNAPKGLAIRGGRLYGADIDELVEIDIKDAKILKRYPAKDAIFFNDVAVAPDGSLYVSDMMTNKIHRLKRGRFKVWLNDAALENPNGLFAEEGRLIVGSWGKPEPDFSTPVPGRLKAVDFKTKKISLLGGSEPAGNLDGVEADGQGGYLVTDWIKGAVLYFSPEGKVRQVLDLAPGSADLEVIPEKSLAVIPIMSEDRVVAFRIRKN